MVAYSFKPRFVAPLRSGLGIRHLNERGMEVIPPARPKRQTIRAHGKRRHAREGETLQLYTGMRTRQCRKIGEARCTRVRNITIWFDRGPDGKPDLTVLIQGEKLLGPRNLKAFAQADGFQDARDMAEFWLQEHRKKAGKFEGRLIEWEPLDAVAA